MTVVITGAGPIGTTVARHYVEAGTPVRVLTRSGSGLEHPLVDRLAVDAGDREAFGAAAAGATVIHHCIHASAYTARAWQRDLPAAEAVVLEVAAELGAVVVFPESLYAFDTSAVVTENTPHKATTGKPGVRARLLAARAAAPARTISVVASDYFGPGAGAGAHIGDRVLRPATTGGTVLPVGSADLPHSWTYLPDLAAAMVQAAQLPPRPDRLLFAPTSAPRTQRQVAVDYATAAGRPAPRVLPVPSWALRLVGRFHAGTAGIVEMLYLFERPQVMDSSSSEAELGLTATPWEEAVAATVEAFCGPASVRRTVASA